MKWEVLEKNKYKGCLGSIYIDLVHEISGIMLNPETLLNFCNELKKELYDSNFKKLILGYNDNEYSFGFIRKQLTKLDSKWIEICYDENLDEVQCDAIKPIIETKVKKTIIEMWSDTCANIYARIIEEICHITREPKPLKSFCNELFYIIEIQDVRDFYITANLGNIKISSIPEDIDDPSYDKENHYYHYYVDENENANFVEIERIGE